MVKHLVAAVAVGVLLSACGGSDNKKQNNSSSSTAVSSAVSSAVVSSAASSAVVSSSSSSEVVVSSSSSEASSEASSSSSSEASSEASSSSSSTGGNAPNCEPNPDSVINTCDTAKWVVDGGNGGSITFGELGPIFTNGAPTGTNSWNKAGMFYIYDLPAQTVVGKTLTLVVVVDQAFKDTGAEIQPVIQQNGGSYGGTWSCNTPNSALVVDGETTVTCVASAPSDGIDSLRLGFQLSGPNNTTLTSYLGTLELIDATWE